MFSEALRATLVVGFEFAWGVFGFGCLGWVKGCRRLFLEKACVFVI